MRRHAVSQRRPTISAQIATPSANPDPAAQERWRQSGLAAQFSHSLEAQIGGQLAADLLLTTLYRFTPIYLATHAIKVADFVWMLDAVSETAEAAD